MILLFTGKTTVFEPLMVAGTFLGKEDQVERLSSFGDIKVDSMGKPVLVGIDRFGNYLYTLGNKNYLIIDTVSKELARIAGTKANPLQVIPVSISGQNVTWYLCNLAKLPIIGYIFTFLAKHWVLSRKQQIITYGQSLTEKVNRRENDLIAAKPMQ